MTIRHGWRLSICAGAAAVAGAVSVWAQGAAPVRLPADAPIALYEHARLIIGDGRPAIDDGAMLVRDGRITTVGRAGRVALPAGGVRVDLSGKTLSPAFINVHTHPGFQRGATHLAANYSRDTYLQDLERSLYFGVATVVSQGIDPGDVALQLRAEQRAGTLGGARLFLAGRGIGAPNAGPGADAYRGVAYEVTTPEQGRQAVGEQADRGVDLIKIWVDDRNGRAPSLTAPAYRAIIDEAHRRGLRVNAHVFYLADLKALVEAGIDGLAHLARDRELDDATVRAIVRKGVTVMPALATPERNTQTDVPAPLLAWLNGPEAAVLTPGVVQGMVAAFRGRDAATAEAARPQYAVLQRSVARLARAGARIALGSDTGTQDHPFGLTDHRELQRFVEAGMTPMQALVAATSRGAEYLRLKDLGVLAPGARANFVVFDANPLERISHTQGIAAVVVDGRPVDREALRARLSASTGGVR
jgi:imidazolonepropionase-like amidohydrolase